MDDKYEILEVDNLPYVSLLDAKRIIGVSTVGELTEHGSSTIQLDDAEPIWSLNWLIELATNPSLENASPDFDWIEQYKNANQPPKQGALAVLPRTENTKSQTCRVNELVRLLPPPDEVPCSSTDWNALEKTISVEYPPAFKSFIQMYGALQWFDWLQPLIPFEDMDSEAFLKYLKQLQANYFDNSVIDGQTIDSGVIGVDGSLLPFMVGSDGDAYAWLVHGNAAGWNVVYANHRSGVVLGPLSISQMLAGWLQGEPEMERVWGTVEKFREHSADALELLE